jgi:hypothetical protein
MTIQQGERIVVGTPARQRWRLAVIGIVMTGLSAALAVATLAAAGFVRWEDVHRVSEQPFAGRIFVTVTVAGRDVPKGTRIRPRRSWRCCRNASGLGRPDHDRPRPFCVRAYRRGTPDSSGVFPSSSGGRGIRTHGDVAATMVFKTIAIGH